MQAQPAPRGDQRAGDRVGEQPLRQHELGAAAAAGLAGGVARDQLCDDRQAGPGMRRQVLLVDAVRRLGLAARQRDGDDQRRRAAAGRAGAVRLAGRPRRNRRRRPGQPRLLAAPARPGGSALTFCLIPAL